MSNVARNQTNQNPMKKSTCSALMGILLTAATTTMLFADDEVILVDKGTIIVEKEAKEVSFVKLFKVSLTEAVQKAVVEKNGVPIKAQLEEKNGFLVWAIDIVGNDNVTNEIFIDAGNGKVLYVGVDRD